jgi:hypothetical protein
MRKESRERDKVCPFVIVGWDQSNFPGANIGSGGDGGTGERPTDHFEREHWLLMKLPPNEYDCSIAASGRAISQALVWFDGNRYSVQGGFAYKTLTIKATSERVAIYASTRILTMPARSYEKNRVIENPKHYEGLLAQRKKARMSKLVESFSSLAPESTAYLKELVAAELNLQPGPQLMAAGPGGLITFYGGCYLINHRLNILANSGRSLSRAYPKFVLISSECFNRSCGSFFIWQFRKARPAAGAMIAPSLFMIICGPV